MNPVAARLGSAVRALTSRLAPLVSVRLHGLRRQRSGPSPHASPHLSLCVSMGCAGDTAAAVPPGPVTPPPMVLFSAASTSGGIGGKARPANALGPNGALSAMLRGASVRRAVAAFRKEGRLPKKGGGRVRRGEARQTGGRFAWEQWMIIRGCGETKESRRATRGDKDAESRDEARSLTRR